MRGRNRGVGLIEVLVSLLVIGIGLLGVVGLHTKAQQAEMESYQRAQALLLVQDMVNRINANRSAADCYLTTANPLGVGFTVSPCAGVGTSVTRTTADADLAAWDSLLDGGSESLDGNQVGAMIGARGCVTYDAVSDSYLVSVAWQGLSATVSSSNPCGEGLYGANEALRRVVGVTVRIADLD